MRAKLRRGYVAAAILAIATALLALSMVAPIISTTTDFSIFNTGWNGTSKLAVSTYQAGKFTPTFTFGATDTDITITQLGLGEIELDPMTDSLVIIGPSKSFTERDGEIVSSFVKEGGLLLIADDFGTGNSLLERIDSKSRFSEKLVMDLSFEKQPEFSVCFNIEEDPLTNNVSRLLLNYPSSLTINSSTTDAIAFSSVASWLDLDGDRMRGWEEPRGPFPIIARERRGNGTIILLADPSVLINGMREQLDNDVFAENLIEEISIGRLAVYFDESHRDYFDPVAITAQFTASLSPNAKFILIFMAFILLLWISTDIVDRAIAWTVRKIIFQWRRIIGLLIGKKVEPPPSEPMSIEEIVEEVAKRHPDWKKGLIRYVLREQERHRKFLERERA